MQFKPESLTFWQLVQGRLFRIPEYQRAYSWRTKQRRELFDDIIQLFQKKHDFHFMSTAVGIKSGVKTVGTDEFDLIEIVDGQQRITTLVILIKAIELKLAEGKDKSSLAEIMIKNDDYTLLLLQTNHDYLGIFSHFIKDGVVPQNRVFDSQADKNLAEGISEVLSFLDEWIEVTGTDLLTLLALIKNRLMFLYHEISDEKLAYTVFEVLNSRGLPVAWLDRTKAVLMGLVFENASNPQEMSKELHQIWARIYRALGLKQGLSSESLRFAATLWDQNQVNRVYSEEASLEVFRSAVQSDIGNAIKISEHLLQTTKTLDKLLKDKSLSAVTKVSQARFLAVAIIQIYEHSDFESGELEKLLEQWERVSFRIYGFARKDSRTKVGDYIRLAKKIINTSPTVEDALNQVRELGKEYPINKVLEDFSSLDNAYDGWQEELRYFMYAREKYLMNINSQLDENEEWARILSASLADTIEHIYPQTATQHDWPLFTEERKSVYAHRLGNLVLLPPKLNSRLSNKAFFKKQEEYRKVGLQCLDELESFLCQSSWSPEAIERREKELLDWAMGRWGDL